MGARNIVFGEIEDAYEVTVVGNFVQHVVRDEHSEWLAEFGNGVYQRASAMDDTGQDDMVLSNRTLYRFSDRDTAFAFKLMFG